MATDIQSQLTGVSPQGVSINDSRRIFNFGERIAELAPEQSPFFSYLSKVAKKPTDDPVFKFLEKRHQWQRRNFDVIAEKTTAAYSSATWALPASFEVDCGYDKYGREAAGSQPQFLLEGQVLAIDAIYSVDGSAFTVNGTNGFNVTAYYRISAAPTLGTNKATIAATFLKAMYKPTGTAGQAATKKGQVPSEGGTIAAGSKLRFAVDAKGQVVGTNWAEGTDDPKGWRDEIYSSEGYTQIFKTAVPMFSGTSLATRYRGDANEYMRVYKEKLMEHKMDIEHAMLFGVGSSDDATFTAGYAPSRKTWGILPYTEAYGQVRMFSKSSSTYDHFVESMEEVFAPEKGNSGEKLVLASRSVLTWLNKLGGNSFLGNTMSNLGAGSSAAGSGMDIQNVKGSFGHNVTRVSTLYGNLNFIAEPLLRGPWNDMAIAIDLNNIAYRPLAANGQSRDTQIMTNVQGNATDGRKDMVLTEAGLEISLPETHTVLNFTA